MEKKFNIFRGMNSDSKQTSEKENYQQLQDSQCDQNAGCQPSVEQISKMSLSRYELDFLADKIGNMMKQFLMQQEQASNAKERNMEFERNVLDYLKLLYRGIIDEDKTTGTKYYSLSKIQIEQRRSIAKLDTMTELLKSMQQMLDSQSKVIEEQASIIKMQHECIIRYENDVMYKTQKDLIMELIGIADQLRFTLSDQIDEKNSILYKSIEDLVEWVDGSLQSVAVRSFKNGDSKELDRKRQEVVEVQNTQNSAEDGLIRSLLPGYVWSVPMVGSNEMKQLNDSPKKFEFIIRPEQVIRLRYTTPVSDTLHSEKGLVLGDEGKDDDNNNVTEEVSEREQSLNEPIECTEMGGPYDCDECDSVKEESESSTSLDNSEVQQEGVGTSDSDMGVF